MIESQDVRMLADLGFIALSRGLDRHADAIFAGVRAVRPDGEAGRIGGALVQLFRGEVEAAVRQLTSAPPTDATRAFLGMALARLGDMDAAKATLEEVIATSSDPAAAEMARATLGELSQTARPDLFAR